MFLGQEKLGKATIESFFPTILPMRSYRDASQTFQAILDVVYLETEQVSVARFRTCSRLFSSDNSLSGTTVDYFFAVSCNLKLSTRSFSSFAMCLISSAPLAISSVAALAGNNPLPDY